MRSSATVSRTERRLSSPPQPKPSPRDRWFCYTGRSAFKGKTRQAAPHRYAAATQVRGVAQPGRAPGSGPGGRRFKSSLPDQEKKRDISDFAHAKSLFCGRFRGRGKFPAHRHRSIAGIYRRNTRSSRQTGDSGPRRSRAIAQPSLRFASVGLPPTSPRHSPDCKLLILLQSLRRAAILLCMAGIQKNMLVSTCAAAKYEG